MSQLFLVVQWSTLGTKVYPITNNLTIDFLQSPAGARLLGDNLAYITNNPPAESLPHVH